MENREYGGGRLPAPGIGTGGRERAALKRDLIISVSFSVLLMLPVLAATAGMENGLPSMFQNAWFLLALSLPVQIFAGRHFYRIAADSLRTGDIDATTVIALAAAGSFILGIYSGFGVPGGIARALELCFCAVILPTLALLGQFMESFAAKRVSSAAEKFLHPAEAGHESNVPVKLPIPGETVTVRPGETIPSDGEVTDGFSGVDESALTGATQPVDKQPGDQVMCASVNLHGTFDMRVKKTGPDTAFASLLRMLENMCDGISPFIKTAENVSRVFAPAAIFAAVVTFAVWWLAWGSFYDALINAVFALAAACPCVLGFSAYSAAVNGTVEAAGNGVVLKRDGRPGNLRRLGAVVLEEPGVVTAAKPEIADITILPGFFEEEVMTFAAAAVKNSRHPLAAAIGEFTRPKVITGQLDENVVRARGGEFVTLRSARHGFVGSALPRSEAFEELTGRGILATVGGREVLVGTRELLHERGISTQEHGQTLARIGNLGQTAILVAINGKAAGIIAATDELREGVPEAVERLKRMGLKVYMAAGTGDIHTSNSLAKKAGIDTVVTELPARKKSGGKTVAAVCGGHGGNAIPEAADIVISIGPGLTYKNADIALLRGDLEALPETINFVGAITRKLSQNLLFALACNVVGIVFAAFGIFSPLFPIVAMALSSAFAAINSGKQFPK